MTPERLADIKARAAAATPGPWMPSEMLSENRLLRGSYVRFEGGHIARMLDKQTPDPWGDEPLSYSESSANVFFLAHARADIPDLLAEVERLRALESRVQEIFVPNPVWGYTELDWVPFADWMDRLKAEKVAAVLAEREACARVAEDCPPSGRWDCWSVKIAAAIRARGDKPA